ncbi:MAG: transglutaminase domain-containing protein [bacterium]|nr:transglutaminase domain-containing protein [bacterium]
MPCDWLADTSERIDRRALLRAAGWGGLAVLAGDFLPAAALDAETLDAAGATSDLSRLKRMDFDVTYRTRIRNLPSDAEDVHVWMPLPPSDPAQEISDLEVRCKLPHEITRDRVWGNRMVHVASRGRPGRGRPKPFTVEARYGVSRRVIGAIPAELDDVAARKYMQLTARVRITDDVAAFAARWAGDATEPFEVGRKIFGGIVDHLSYDKTIPGCGTGDTAWIMRHRRGKCDDYHALFMAAMISRGIPVRWEQGFPLPLPRRGTNGKRPEGGKASSGRLVGDCSGAHCWASFYDPARGWVPVDVSEADKGRPDGDFFFGSLTPNRFKVSEGRAVVLEPAQGGDPRPTFAFAYAEADGIPLIYDGNYENTIRYKIRHVEES